MKEQSEKRPIFAQGEPVPPWVHQVWLGGESLPPILGAFVDGVQFRTSRELWHYMLWDDRALGHDFPEWPELCDRCSCLSGQSDVARYLILEKFGGLYLDTDVELFGFPEEWWSGSWIAGTQENPTRSTVNGCCLACEPGSDFIGRILGKIRSGQVDLGKHMEVGPLLCAACMDVDVNIWPGHVWHGKRGQPGALGHHYGWGPHLKSFLRGGKMPPTT